MNTTFNISRPKRHVISARKKPRNHNLEEQAQALYKSWFVDFEPFKDGNFVKTEMGLIPEGWAVKQLGEVTNEMRDKVGNNKVTKVLSPINTGQLVLSEDFFSKQVYSESIAKYLIVKPGDFAYNPARVNIGSLGVNDFPFDGCVSPVYVVFRCENGYNYFFDLYRKTEPFKEEVLARSNGGVRQTLGYKDFALISLVYPPKCVIESFNSIYKSLLDIQKHNQAQINTLSEQRDTLLPLLMSGELSILDSNN
jgi:type I restriction enzyme S subunit